MEAVIAKYDYVNGTSDMIYGNLKYVTYSTLQRSTLNKECEANHKTLTYTDCQNFLFDLLLDILSNGLGSTHFELVSEICDVDDFVMYEFIPALKGPGVKRLFDAMKQQKYRKEKEYLIGDYANSFKRCMERLIGLVLWENEEGKCDRKEPDVHTECLDLYMFFMVQMTKYPKNMASDLFHIQNEIRNSYNRKPYSGCENTELYKRHLDIIKRVLLGKSFPRTETEKDASEDVIKRILDGIADDQLEKALLSDLKNFVDSLFSSSNADQITSIVKDCKKIIDKLEAEMLKDNPIMFESWAQTFAEKVNQGTNKDFLESTGPREVRDKLEDTKPLAEHNKYWILILKAMLKRPLLNMSYQAERLIKSKKILRIWNWKKNVEEAKQIVIIAKEADLPTENSGDNRDIVCHYGETIKELFVQLKFVNVSHLVMPELASLIISSLERRSSVVNRMPQICMEVLDFSQKNQEVIPDFLKRFSVIYCDSDYPWTGWSLRTAWDLLEAVVEAYTESSDIQKNVNVFLIDILNYSMSHDTERIDFETRSLSTYGITASRIMKAFVYLHLEGGTGNVLLPMVPSLFRMVEDDNEEISASANEAIANISAKAPKLLAGKDDFNRIIDRYIDTGDSKILGNLEELYPHNTGIMAKRFQDIFRTLGREKENTEKLFALLLLISDKQPEIFTKANVEKMSKYLDAEEEQIIQVLMIWEKIVIKNPDVLLNKMDPLMHNKNIPLSPLSGGLHYTQEILVTIAVKYKKYLDTVLKFLMQLAKDDQEQFIHVYHGLRKLAEHYGSEPFKPYRKYIEKLESSSAMYTKDSAASLINVLENRSLGTVSSDIKQVKEDVNELDERVTGTEIVIGGVVQQVEKHEGEIKDVQVGVANVNKRVDDVEEEIVEVKEKVEEIDMKTMSNAPAWSRDVTKLLNPGSDHDWRLLASRLGYTNDDIRAWATQSDPCMALLSEWYATHNTREATNGVLNVLQEMNRLDAVVIVENAMKAAEDVVEDEEFEYPSPPPVFLSYQWGHQNEVKLLRQHLLMAGYECWMDVGQMGGGDKLFEKIDAGIRGAKVIICCVSEKYAKSPNCNREVNLAVTLRKPMIPLQMEKIIWPPVGSMGPIFSEYLYIRFYSSGRTSGKYWDAVKFQELLMQLQFNNVVPDEKLIAAEYKNWWIPVAEEVIVKKPDNKSGSKTTKADGKYNENKEEHKEKSPKVFLSYQWGKQKQIQALYKRLTGLGFHCWMDIHQMGGGDSLYDKIDRGIRGCKVVLSSVTQKYALSANCRREVSLADALKKPVIPLLMEKIDWPPSGPMSMVFTQLLYIDFSNGPEVQIKWTGNEFDQLMKKLKENLPEMRQANDGKTKNQEGKSNSTSTVRMSTPGKAVICKAHKEKQQSPAGQENTNVEPKPKFLDNVNQSNKLAEQPKEKHSTITGPKATEVPHSKEKHSTTGPKATVVPHSKEKHSTTTCSKATEVPQSRDKHDMSMGQQKNVQPRPKSDENITESNIRSPNQNESKPRDIQQAPTEKKSSACRII